MADPFDMGPEFLGKIPLFAELQRLLNWSGGPVNWDIANQLATATAASAQGAGAKAVNQAAAQEAARHAALLIDSVTDLPSGDIDLIGPVEFAEVISKGTRELFEAVAVRASAGFTEGMGLPEQLPEGIGEAMKSLGPLMHGAQAGSGLGAAASNAIGWCDLGLPVERASGVLIPVVVGRITREHGLDERASLLASLLRVGVDQAVVSSSSSLRSRFLSAYLGLVSTLENDLSQLGEQLRDIDPSDPAALQNLLGGGMSLERSASSHAASAAVDSITALYLAAVDRYVVACGAQAGLDPATLRATAERRNSEEVTAFRALLGLAPIDISSAENFVATIVLEGGFELLKVALDDPMRAPSAQHLQDPQSWISSPGLSPGPADQ